MLCTNINQSLNRKKNKTQFKGKVNCSVFLLFIALLMLYADKHTVRVWHSKLLTYAVRL